MMLNNPSYTNLISDLKDRNVIIWVGAGYSKRLGFPNWKEFALRIAEKYYENDADGFEKFQEAISKKDTNLMSLLGSFDKVKRNTVFDILPELFKLPYTNPEDPQALPFKKLWRLSSKIITTNYDLSLNEAKEIDCRTVVWNRKEDYKNFIDRKEKYLFKLHGTIKDSRNCIIFPDQYDEVYKKTDHDEPEKITYYFLRHLVTDHKILFIGYGGFNDDVYIDSTFEYVHKIVKSFSDKKHYILKPETADISRDYLEPIEFEKYSDLDSIIDDLLHHISTYKATSDQIDSFIPEYIGRYNERNILREFIESVDSKFLFMWGKGGIGKTHLLKTVLSESKTQYLYFQLNSASSLQSLADKLNLGIVIDHNKIEEYSTVFIDAFEKVNVPVIFDDFYEIDTKDYPNPKLKNTLLQLKESKSNKVIIISRALDSTFSYLPNLEIKYLEPEEHEQFVKAYLNYEGSHLKFENLDNTISNIWGASRGYPLVSQIFLDILGQPYAYPDFNLEEFGRFDYEKYDNENNQGKEYVEKLISVVLNGKDEASRELLLNFSLAIKEMPYELLRKLPHSNQFKIEQRRKDYIIISKSTTGEYSFSLHPLVWEIFRKKAGSRPDVHLIMGKFYLDKFINNYDDIEAYTLSEYHYNFTTDEGITYFNTAIKSIIDKANIKEILSSNIEATIERLKLKRSFGSNAAINHQLATQYYLLDKIPEALNEIEIGLLEYVDNEHLLLQKAIIQKEEGQIESAEKTFIKILDINPLNKPARNEIGIFYLEWAKEQPSEEKEEKFQEAEKWLKPLAEEKNILACNVIAILYREWAKEKRSGEKEEKYKEAEKWLKRAIEKGNLPSKNEIGILYREWAKEKRSEEKEEKYKEAEKWLKPLAEEGNLPSKNEIGILYREWAKEKRSGEKEEKYKEAEKWLKRAIEKGNLPSKNEIGILYREWAKEKRPEEKEEKYKEAEKWLKPLAEEGHLPSKNEIGILYREWAKEKRSGEKGEKYKEAEKWLKPLTEEGNLPSKNEIGILYREWAKEKRSEEKEEKYKEAEKWLKALAEDGLIHARNEIGILYREWAKEKRSGEKEAKYNEAEKWLKALAEDGLIHARNELGILYREWAKEKRSEEKEAKFQEAEKWLRLLADEKNILARNELGILYREWAKEKRSEEKEAKFQEAEKWLKPLAEEQHIHARNEIGILYREWAKEKRSEEKEAKFQEAEKWLKPLAEEQHIHARNEIGILYREWAKEKRSGEKEEKYKEAEKWLKPLAEESNIPSMNEIGILYREWAKEKRSEEKEEKYKEAEKWLVQLTKDNNVLATNELALLYRNWGSKDFQVTDKAKLLLAVTYYKLAIELKSNNIQSYDGLCKTLELLEEYDECVQWGDVALKIKNDDRILNLLIGVCLYKLRDKVKALLYFNKLRTSSNFKKKWEEKLV